MKFQSQFSGRNKKKNFKMSPAEFFTSVLRLKMSSADFSSAARMCSSSSRKEDYKVLMHINIKLRLTAEADV